MKRNILKQISRYIKPYSTSKGERWEACLPDGTGGQLRKKGFLDKEIAKNWAELQMPKILERKSGLPTKYSAQLFSEYSMEWLESRRQDWAPATYRRYSDELKLRINPFFGEMRLSEISKQDANEYFEQLRKEPGLNNTSRNMSFGLFKKLVLHAERMDLMPNTGILNLARFKSERTKSKFWEADIRDQFLKASINHPRYLLWKFAVFSGLRAGEIAALKWECVKLRSHPEGNVYGHLLVQRSCCQKTKLIRETTKNGDSRQVPILKDVFEVLCELPRAGEFVFGGPSPIDTKHLARELRLQAKQVGVAPITFHQLRHTFCSWIDYLGISQASNSAVMGHKNRATTDQYRHVSRSNTLKEFETFMAVH